MGHFDYKTSYRRNLPHLQPRGVTIFVTFRLAGSLPASLIDQWQEERKWLAHLEHSNPTYFAHVATNFERSWFRKISIIIH
jgi:hypothetical protein